MPNKCALFQVDCMSIFLTFIFLLCFFVAREIELALLSVCSDWITHIRCWDTHVPDSVIGAVLLIIRLFIIYLQTINCFAYFIDIIFL